MAYRTSIFIDFWNFSLQWRNRAYGERIDWTRVPSALLAESERQLQSAGSGDMLHLEETLVYASYDEDDAGRKLKGWLDAFLDKQPRFRVTTRVRRSKARSVYCRACEHSIEKCPHCEEILRWAPEKGVDTSIVTGLLSLAGERAFDAALLVSSRHRLPARSRIAASTWLQGHQRHVGQPRPRARPRLLGVVRARLDRARPASTERRAAGHTGAGDTRARGGCRGDDPARPCSYRRRRRCRRRQRQCRQQTATPARPKVSASPCRLQLPARTEAELNL